VNGFSPAPIRPPAARGPKHVVPLVNGQKQNISCEATYGDDIRGPSPVHPGRLIQGKERMAINFDETLIGLDNAAKTLAVSRRTVVRAVGTGQLPSLKIGCRRLIRRDALLAWLKTLEAA
jgi:excisionase family DNA binding protein